MLLQLWDFLYESPWKSLKESTVDFDSQEYQILKKTGKKNKLKT